MPNGKKAGERCIQLDENNLCKLFGDESRPKVCSDFSATRDVCGSTNAEALALITELEQLTSLTKLIHIYLHLSITE